MEWKLNVVLEGLPERVQQTADVLDRAFPGLMTSRRFAEPGRDHGVRLENDAVGRNEGFPRSPHLTNQTAALGKPWKLSPATGRVSPRGGSFCASLSKSLPR